MKRVQNIFILMIATFLLVTCTEDHDPKGDIEGIWLGNYRHEAYLFPNPYLITILDKDKAYRYSFETDKTDTLDWSYSSKTSVVFDGKMLEYSVSNNYLDLKEGFQKRFSRVKLEKSNINATEVKEKLIKYSWINKSKPELGEDLTKTSHYTFYDDSLNIDHFYDYNSHLLHSERESIKYKVKVMYGKQYLIFYGSKVDMESNYIEVYEIDYQLNGDIHLISQRGLLDTRLTLSKANKSLPTYEIVEFNFCLRNYVQQYYTVGTKLVGGLSAIRSGIDQEFLRTKCKTESGIVRIRFVVNCMGNVGNPSIQGLDFNYELKTFSNELIGELFRSCFLNREWKVVKNGIENYDSYKHFTFRIDKGEIMEIFP